MNMQNPCDRPSAVLKAEHQVILRVIGVLQRLIERSEQGQGFEREALGQCVEFFRWFADACHHAKEEDLLFPKLVERGVPKEEGPIGVMLYEHKVARALTKEMGEALSSLDDGHDAARDQFSRAANQYIDLLRGHIFKEDNVLFNMGDQVMTEEDQSSLCTKFCEVGCQSFGGKKREALELMADQLESAWPCS